MLSLSWTKSMDQMWFVRPQPDDGRSVMIEPLALLVPSRQLKPFFAPEALYLLVIDPPAFQAQKLADFAVPVPSVLLGEADQSKTQIIVVLLL